MIETFVIAIVVGFMLGGLPFGYWIALVAGAGDIRQRGSGNTGATNVWRVIGATAGSSTLILDIGKGVAAVLVASALSASPEYAEYLKVSAGLSSIAGHIFSPFLGFRGGKGVNTSLGVFATLLPQETAVALVAFLIVVASTRYISLGSVVAAIALFLAALVETLFDYHAPAPVYLALTSVVASLIVFAHRSNLARIFSGSENKFNWRGKSA